MEIDAASYSPMAKASQLPAPEEEEIVVYQEATNIDDEYYDMSKKKYLLIFNHFTFKRTRAFGNDKPKNREGTHFDQKILKHTFQSLGFDVKPYQDLTHDNIITAIEKLINQDHKNTSCVALAFLTHGTKDGYLFAEDQHYELKQITKMLESKKLALIPKLLFLQVSVETDMPRRPRVEKMLRRMNSLRSSVKRYKRTITSQILKFWVQLTSSESTLTTDAAPINNGACRGQALDRGHHVEVDSNIRIQVHVPSHIDFLILHSAADGHASFRCNKEGSWMIQSLCEIIQKHHKTHDILQLITLVNRKVAFDHTASNPAYPSLNNKKQSLEAKFTLTKFLKL